VLVLFGLGFLGAHLLPSFGYCFSGLLMGSPINFALYTVLCGSSKKIKSFFDMFLMHGLFGLFFLHCNSHFEFDVRKSTIRLFNSM
jgi:hypothetical protein